MPAHPRRTVLAGLLLAGALLSGCLQAAGAKPPADAAAYGSTQPSAQGAFRVSYRSDPAHVPVGRLHAWTLHVETADGQPVTAAAITLDGDMPEHRHGLPTKPRVTRHLGNGDYLVEGVKFQMGGWWVMDFQIAAAGRRDTVRFHLKLSR
jgi:hypothetical protein